MAKASSFNRVCFWLPRAWRARLLAILKGDGRPQGEFIRAAVVEAVKEAEKGPEKK